MYIGQTVHFEERHKQHYNGTEEKFNTADFDQAIVILSQYFNGSALDDVERQMIQYFMADNARSMRKKAEVSSDDIINRTGGNKVNSYTEMEKVATEVVTVEESLDTAEPEPVVEEVPPVEDAKPENKPVENKPAVTTSRSKDLGYATWKGALKNGQPNDENGTMTYKESHRIDSRDPQARVAEPGDYIIGEFVDGKLVQGIWYDKSNTVKGSIIIGR